MQAINREIPVHRTLAQRAVVVCVIASLSTLSGCTAIGRLTGTQPDGLGPDEWPEFQKNLAAGLNSADWTRTTAKAYARVTAICISVANYYERNGKYGDNTRLTIGLIGSIAAGVVAPALAAANAARSVIAIWAGVGGVSAGFLTSYDQSQFAAKANIDVYNRIQQSLAAYEFPGVMSSQEQAQAELMKLSKLYASCKLPVLIEASPQNQIDAANAAVTKAGDALAKATAAQKAAEAAATSAALAASTAAAEAAEAAAATAKSNPPPTRP